MRSKLLPIVFLCITSTNGYSDPKKIIDLTYVYDESTIYWPTAEPFEKHTVSEGTTTGGFYYSAYEFATAEHGGTHLDAPVHFYENGATVEQIPLDKLIGNAICIDVSSHIDNDKDALIPLVALQAWEAENGAIPAGSIVLLRTGWGAFWPDAERYLGTAERGTEAVEKLHFPGLSESAAEWLVRQRQINAIGIDTASIDRGQSSDYLAHRVFAKAGVPVFENVANLNGLPEAGFEIIALPVKIKGGSGGPTRIIAILDE